MNALCNQMGIGQPTNNQDHDAKCSKQILIGPRTAKKNVFKYSAKNIARFQVST